MNIGQVPFLRFMDQDEIEVNNIAKKKEANIQPFWGNNRVQRKSFLQVAIWASWS